MRHRVANRKLGLPTYQRRALLKSLVRALFINDRIITTETRAKEVRTLAEELITMARRGGTNAAVTDRLHARRQVRRFLDSNIAEFGVDEKGKNARNPHYVVPRLFEEIAPRYMNRPGGYTRIIRIGQRRGDAAPMAVLELVEGDNVTPATPAAPSAVARRRGLFGRRK